MLYAGYDSESDMFVKVEGRIVEAKENRPQQIRTSKFYLIPDREEEICENFHLPTLHPVYVEISDCQDRIIQKLEEFKSCTSLWDLTRLHRSDQM